MDGKANELPAETSSVDPATKSSSESKGGRVQVLDPKPEWKKVTMGDVVSEDHLKMISQASGGLRFAQDPNLAQEFLQTGILKAGYTNMNSGTIYINPICSTGIRVQADGKVVEIPPWDEKKIKGFTYHEAGHHSPAARAYQENLGNDLTDPDIIAPSYRGSAEAEQRFLHGIHSHLHNGLADMWMESYMSRRPYFVVREAIDELGREKELPETMKNWSKPEQLVQALVRAKAHPIPEFAGKVDPDVYESLESIVNSNALNIIWDRRAYENYFASEADRGEAIKRKFAAYKTVFLPEYLKLVENELADRRKQEQQNRDGKDGKQGKPGGQGQGRSSSEAVPLTPEEEKKLLEQLIKELEKAGQEFGSQAPAKEDQDREGQQIKMGIDASRARHDPTAPRPKPAPTPERGSQAIRDLMESLIDQQRAEAQRGMAESLGVRQESVTSWEEIKNRCREDIDSTASALADVFLDDRRFKLAFLMREGEIVPGLEYETVSAMLSGQLDPETKMKVVRNPEFLETEIEFIVDCSGSMSEANKIERSIDLMVIVTEAFKKVRETLADEDLLASGEEPFRIGVTKFSEHPTRVTPLSESLNDQKEIKIIDEVAKVGGGTDESEALGGVYKELTLGQRNVAKIMIVLTDGAGNQSGVAGIVRQVEDDDEVVFLAVGLGNSAETAQGIVSTYLDPLRDREKNVFGIAAENSDQVLPQILEFLKREVQKRKR